MPKGNALGGGLKPGGQRVVAPLGHLDLAALHVAPGVGREAARLQADDVGRIAAVEAPCRRQHLEIVGGGVSEEAQVLAPLSDYLVDDGVGDAVGAETADREVAAVGDELSHRLLLRHPLVDHGPRLVAEELARLVRIGIHEQRIDPFIEHFHTVSSSVAECCQGTTLQR